MTRPKLLLTALTISLIFSACSSTINKENGDKLTPLMIAAAKGENDNVKALLSRGASINQQNSSDGLTALMCAAYWGHRDVVKMLLDNGASVGVKDKGDRAAIDYAAAGGATEAAKELASKGAQLKPQAGGLGLYLSVGTMPLNLLKKAAGKD